MIACAIEYRDKKYIPRQAVIRRTRHVLHGDIDMKLIRHHATIPGVVYATGNGDAGRIQGIGWGRCEHEWQRQETDHQKPFPNVLEHHASIL